MCDENEKENMKEIMSVGLSVSAEFCRFFFPHDTVTFLEASLASRRGGVSEHGTRLVPYMFLK